MLLCLCVFIHLLMKEEEEEVMMMEEEVVGSQDSWGGALNQSPPSSPQSHPYHHPRSPLGANHSKPNVQIKLFINAAMCN